MLGVREVPKPILECMALQVAPSRAAGLPSTAEGPKQPLRRVQKSRVGLQAWLLLCPPVAYACLPHLPTEWGEGSTDSAGLCFSTRFMAKCVGCSALRQAGFVLL